MRHPRSDLIYVQMITTTACVALLLLHVCLRVLGCLSEWWWRGHYTLGGAIGGGVAAADEAEV
jgi:hypothetical protein